MNNNTNHPTTMRIDWLEAKAGRSAFERLKGEESITTGLATMKTTYHQLLAVMIH